ncbi:hypothetical protein [Hyphomonas johnsonii]|uniref:Uncharacterized protein n=1 Tax=Hyphomonas johnsonii MHS-2 TaxID=1280950 RepID=A0A059FCH2_9PROT|nr:hypothetical protein [Hyphomonas johnsonii]KCZ88324.1 hypothetical protein HJO_15718 [Hyphomonas johnsonii MHS-2]
MYHFLTKVLSRISEVIRIFALSIVGLMMLSTGLVLAIGGRPEALIPLVLGGFAVFNLRKLVLQLYREIGGAL